MRYTALFSLALLAWAPVSAQNAAPESRGSNQPKGSAAAKKSAQYSGPFALADQAIDDAAQSIAGLKKCFDAIAVLRRDVANKKKDIQARYGSIPESYASLIAMKAHRVITQQELCRQQGRDDAFVRASNALRGVEPKSISGFEERRERLEDLRTKFNDALSRANQ
ncbi:MAG: hypothetical protein HY077_16745 [Elusimicrobia bacterium]|nr:hypothetical protein [Elusimicrobiota bacterium]